MAGDFHKLVARFTKEAKDAQHPDYGRLEWCLHCPGNGWSMNEIWKHAVPLHSQNHNEHVWAFWSGHQDLRAQYDYDEPAGYPTGDDPHSSLPNDWYFNEEGHIVEPQSRYGPGLSEIRKDKKD